ncbi:MAG TPA: cupin domain-containing protein [Longimicrobiales bacterium]
MRAFVDDIEHLTEDNRDFRRVIFTGKHVQLVLMTLQPDEELGEEIHEETDQFFRFEAGKGEVVIDGKPKDIEKDFAVIVPAGLKHNVRNTGHKPLKFYTLYAPPHHMDGTIQHTKVDAELAAQAAG